MVAAPAKPISFRAQATPAARASRQKDRAVEKTFWPWLLELGVGEAEEDQGKEWVCDWVVLHAALFEMHVCLCTRDFTFDISCVVDT